MSRDTQRRYPSPCTGLVTWEFCTLVFGLILMVLVYVVNFCQNCTKPTYLAMFVLAVLQDYIHNYTHHTTASERAKNQAFQLNKQNRARKYITVPWKQLIYNLGHAIKQNAPQTANVAVIVSHRCYMVILAVFLLR